MMHVVGAQHVQSRLEDRNKVISFNWDHITKYSELSYAGYDLSNAREYDLSSVLHYPLTV